MKILSVAEDNLYSLWQLELQIHHFKKLGIDEYLVPIVVGKIPFPNKIVQALSEKKKKIFYYPYENFQFFVNRDYYPPSLQSYGIYKYLQQFPETKRYLINDCDVLFQSAQDFYNLFSLEHSGVYSSPAIYNRLNFYGKPGDDHDKAYNEMLDYMKLDRKIVEDFEKRFENNKYMNPAGHTIFINQIQPDIFKKITEDSIALYDILKVQPKEVKENLSWMASIWSYYYNILMVDDNYQASPLLDFCWAHDPVVCKKPLIHFTGTTKNNENKWFCKMDFLDKSPLNPENYEKVNSYKTNSMSYIYTNLIREYWNFDPVCV